MRLRTRVTLAMLLLGLAVLAGALSSLYVSERTFLLREAELEARNSTLKLAKVCEEAVAGDSDLVALNYMKAWKETPGASRAVLLRADGRVYLDSYMIGGTASTVGKPLEEPDEGFRTLRLEEPVVVFKKAFGKVVAYYDLAMLEDRVDRALRSMAGRMIRAGAIALALGVVLALWLAHTLASPIQDLVGGARRVGAGDFNSPIDPRREDELGQLAKEFNAMAQKLQESDQMKDRFLHSVSHEMRAPLSVLASAAYHARRVAENGKKDGLLEDINQIERGVERLTGFVNNILDLARLEARRTSFDFGKVETPLLLADARAAYSRKAEEFKVLLSVEEPAGLGAVRADAGRVGQVLSNLILNALKFTPEGGKVTVRAEPTYGAVLFSVSDTGPGIPAEAQSKLFLRFGLSSSPAPNPRKLPSSGLGLSICKEIVDAHGGKIWARSEPGGSTFSFTLPLWDEEKK